MHLDTVGVHPLQAFVEIGTQRITTPLSAMRQFSQCFGIRGWCPVGVYGELLNWANRGQ